VHAPAGALGDAFAGQLLGDWIAADNSRLYGSVTLTCEPPFAGWPLYENFDLDIPIGKLTVITGLSGSGKSSLAFDTLYAEGQRRYIESLSAYARQFLGQMDKPVYDSIRGLAPTISIEQKAASGNPRSTVGTITEIHDYLRVLWARVGRLTCHRCGRAVGQGSLPTGRIRQGSIDGVDLMLQRSALGVG
jgi:hypothetical protein